MPTYKNGFIPRELLVSVGSGTDAHGEYQWLLSPGTAAKHRALVARALKRTGRALSPSPGYSCYRSYYWQQMYRAIWGNGAAVPGTSSHGGVWEGQQTLAIDYGNWAWVYEKYGARKQDEFFADVRAVGLEPGLISRARGYPDEPWHVIDLAPWAAPASTTATPFPVPAVKEEPTMYIARNAGDSAEQGARFIWGDGLAPEIISKSTADIFIDAGVVEESMDRGRWLWLLEWARKRAATTGTIDYAALAKAVNDDAARRMVS